MTVKKIVIAILIVYTLAITTLLIIAGSRLSNTANIVDDKQAQIDLLKSLSIREEKKINAYYSKIDSLKTLVDRIDFGITSLKKNREQIVLHYTERRSNLEDLSLDSLKKVSLED